MIKSDCNNTNEKNVNEQTNAFTISVINSKGSSRRKALESLIIDLDRLYLNPQYVFINFLDNERTAKLLDSLTPRVTCIYHGAGIREEISTLCSLNLTSTDRKVFVMNRPSELFRSLSSKSPSEAMKIKESLARFLRLAYSSGHPVIFLDDSAGEIYKHFRGFEHQIVKSYFTQGEL